MYKFKNYEKINNSDTIFIIKYLNLNILILKHLNSNL